MWVIIVAVIGGLILTGVILFSIPLDLAWRLEVSGKPRFNLRWAWLFGLISREIKTRQRPRKKKPRRRPGINKVFERIRKGFQFLKIKDLVKALINLIRGILSRMKIKTLEAEFVIGLDDPAETFYLFAFTEPLNLILRYSQPYAVTIRPYFIGPAFEGYFQGSLRLYPIQLVPPVIRFLFSRPAFRAMKTVIKQRWRKRK